MTYVLDIPLSDDFVNLALDDLGEQGAAAKAFILESALVSLRQRREAVKNEPPRKPRPPLFGSLEEKCQTCGYTGRVPVLGDAVPPGVSVRVIHHPTPELHEVIVTYAFDRALDTTAYEALTRSLTKTP